ncbi:MAG: hypothetical protein FWC75_02955 [Oscillospiraceae bacterium]|nr:hypothetical protein [Oscillospiraceae bacterium]
MRPENKFPQSALLRQIGQSFAEVAGVDWRPALKTQPPPDNATVVITKLRNNISLLQEEVFHLRAQLNEGAMHESPSPQADAEHQRALAPKAASASRLAQSAIGSQRINARSARHAIIMSEIIGQPLSMRSRRR